MEKYFTVKIFVFLTSSRNAVFKLKLENHLLLGTCLTVLIFPNGRFVHGTLLLAVFQLSAVQSKVVLVMSMKIMSVGQCSLFGNSSNVAARCDNPNFQAEQGKVFCKESSALGSPTQITRKRGRTPQPR